MYNKLTKDELQIIEDTKKQGCSGSDATKEKRGLKIIPYVFLVVIFILLAFGAKIVISLLG